MDLPAAGGQPRIGWRASIAGTSARMLAGGGKLLVVTAEGTLCCFGETPALPRNHPARPIDAARPADTWPTRGREILEQAGVRNGYCLALGLGSGRLVEELARQSELQIIVGAAKPPFGVLWFGGEIGRMLPPFKGPVPRIAAGRMFLQAGNELHAADIYTGRHLWRRPLGRAGQFLAADGELYAISGGVCLRLDPAKGELLGTIAVPASLDKTPGGWEEIRSTTWSPWPAPQSRCCPWWATPPTSSRPRRIPPSWKHATSRWADRP